MTCKPVRIPQSIHQSWLAIAVILFAGLGCSDASVPPSRSTERTAPAGQSDSAFLQVRVPEIRAAIEAVLVNGRAPVLAVLTPPELLELNALYERDEHLPLWVDAEGRPHRSVHDALTVLSGAADEGLDPADYRAGQLDRQFATLHDASPDRTRDLAGFDIALSSSMLRYFHDVHSGRVDPKTIGLRLGVPCDTHDLAGLLRSAVANHRIAETVANLRPPLEQYGALRTMLTQYRSLSAHATAEAIPPFAAVVHPGEQYGGLGILDRQLVAVGDLPPGTRAPAESGVFDRALVEGVKRFQLRHGLEVDGVLGKRTQEALRIPLTWRVRQIELALERLRWLPHLSDERVLAINIPMFRLWVWDSIPASRNPALGMDVIVGRALTTQTPIFAEQLREVIFRPYWNVPQSIVRHEILPALERDPDYLGRQDMEIVRGAGDNAQAVAATAENLARLRQGALRLRQRPGPRNSLGLVKFVFPNEENVYLHGTPAPELFRRSRRDFSHGCVRVQDPVALAEWVLKDWPEWNRDRILSAMAGTQSLHVKLSRPIQVILFYTTAAVMPEDGTIRFADDLYGHDARLDRALTLRQFLH